MNATSFTDGGPPTRIYVLRYRLREAVMFAVYTSSDDAVTAEERVEEIGATHIDLHPYDRL